MLLTNILKFIHVIFALSLLGSVIYCLFLVSSKKFALANSQQHASFLRINKFIMRISVLALVTGSFLIYPRHFTLHTPWIRAAYLFTIIFAGAIGILNYLKRKNVALKPWVCLTAYLLLSGILIAIIHDAVTKTTFV